MRLIVALFAIAAFGLTFAEDAAPGAGVEKEKKHDKELNEKSSLKSIGKVLDADKNGELSADELAANKNEKIAAKLAALDTNKDGALDKAELEAGKAAEAAAKPAEKKEGGHGEMKEGEQK